MTAYWSGELQNAFPGTEWVKKYAREPPTSFRVWNELYSLVAGSGIWTGGVFELNMEHLFQSFTSGKMCVFLDKDNHVSGYFTVDSVDSAKMAEIGMVQSFRRGVGSLMINYMKDRYTGLHLHSTSKTTAFWVKMGFKQTDPDNNRVVYEWKKND